MFYILQGFFEAELRKHFFDPTNTNTLMKKTKHN